MHVWLLGVMNLPFLKQRLDNGWSTTVLISGILPEIENMEGMRSFVGKSTCKSMCYVRKGSSCTLECETNAPYKSNKSQPSRTLGYTTDFPVNRMALCIFISAYDHTNPVISVCIRFQPTARLLKTCYFRGTTLTVGANRLEK